MRPLTILGLGDNTVDTYVDLGRQFPGGNAVNVASRMESHSLPGRIQVTAAIEERLRGRYRFEPRGRIALKGIGEMSTFFLVGPCE